MCIREIEGDANIEALEDVWTNASDITAEQKWSDVQEEIKNSDNITYVKIAKDSIVGFIVVARQFDPVRGYYIRELFTYPQGHGYGAELLKEMQKTRSALSLHVKKTNENAIRFYEKNKFNRVATNHRTKYFMRWTGV